jgi:hypothetical protein
MVEAGDENPIEEAFMKSPGSHSITMVMERWEGLN